MPKRALIIGISGQDGSYLAKFLLRKGYDVTGTSRDAQMSPFSNLEYLGIREKIGLASMSVNDFRSVVQVLTKTNPHEIYNLGGQSSVGLSFEQPAETFESITVGTLNLLEAIRILGLPAALYNACSGECFGNTSGEPADESTPFRPRSPYAVAKAAAFWQVANYREAYDLFACSGILFNHESPLRPRRFVTRKVVAAACRIAAGSAEKLALGNISVERDWGWAPEYVEAMWLMLQQTGPSDFVIATGESHTLEEFVACVFGCLGLNWEEYVIFDGDLLRPADILISRADASRARKELNWRARYKMEEVARMMIEGERDGRAAK